MVEVDAVDVAVAAPTDVVGSADAAGFARLVAVLRRYLADPEERDRVGREGHRLFRQRRMATSLARALGVHVQPKAEL
jgi:hypothetical protein